MTHADHYRAAREIGRCPEIALFLRKTLKSTQNYSPATGKYLLQIHTLFLPRHHMHHHVEAVVVAVGGVVAALVDAGAAAVHRLTRALY
jgi:hypothetical protein